MTPEAIVSQVILVVLGAGGAAWAGMKVGQNGLSRRLDRLETKVDCVQETQIEHGERLARIEAKIN